MTKTKILIVDDELQIRRLLQVGLSGYEYDILAAPNGHFSEPGIGYRFTDMQPTR
jgi:CheY-like chemotaxis protein